ncbi:hypothetical protein BAC7755_29940 [Bacillus sp. MN7755]
MFLFSKGHTVIAKQTVTVKQNVETKDEDPVLTVPTEVTIHVGDKYNPLSGVKAIDKEDGDITDKVIHMGEVDTSKAGNPLTIYKTDRSVIASCGWNN